MIDNILLLFLISLLNVLSYFDMRIILWSIIRCEARKKGKKWRTYKETLQSGRGIREQISMRYLLHSAQMYQKEFLFWLRCKNVFTFAEFVVTMCYLLYSIIVGNSKTGNMIDLILLGQSVLVFLLMRFQFGLDGHLSRYDRIRLHS